MEYPPALFIEGSDALGFMREAGAELSQEDLVVPPHFDIEALDKVMKEGRET